MSKVNDGGPAYPTVSKKLTGIKAEPMPQHLSRWKGEMSENMIKELEDWQQYSGVPVYEEEISEGMSLRDKFAEQALNGMLSHATRYRPVENDPRHWHDVISQESYMIADAMLRAREK